MKGRRHSISLFATTILVVLCICATTLLLRHLLSPHPHASTPNNGVYLNQINTRGVGWQQKNGIFIYSAYTKKQEKITEPIRILVVAVIPTNWTHPLQCRLSDLGATSKGVVVQNRYYLNFKYSSALIKCRFTSGHVTNSTSLHIMIPSKDSSGIKVPIQTVPEVTEKEELHDFAICVQPLYNYNSVIEFLEWYAFHVMMGVTHFTLYDMSVGPELSCVIQSLGETQGIPITVLPWNLSIPEKGIRLHAQVAQSNDSLWRYKGIAKRVLFIDLDEFLVPNFTIAKNFGDMMDVISQQFGSKGIAQYQFRSTFYGSDVAVAMPTRMEGPKNGGAIDLQHLRTYKSVWRKKTLYPFGTRSKFISIPELVIEPGIHYMEQSINNSVEVQVPEDIAYVHHMRDYRCGSECEVRSQIIENSIHIVINRLLQDIRTLFKTVKGKCGNRIINDN